MKQVRRSLSLLLALLMIVSCFGGLSVFADELDLEPETEALPQEEIVLAEEAPVEEAPAEETPAEEAPAEEAPAEEAPAKEAPAGEAPVEEAPAEDALIVEAESELDLDGAPGDWGWWGTVTVTPIEGAAQPVAGEAFNDALYTYEYDLPPGTHARAVYVVWPTGEPLVPWSPLAAPSGVSAVCRDGKVYFNISENAMQEQYNFRVVVVCEDYYFWHDYDWHYIMSETQTLNHIGTMEYSSEGYTGVYDGEEHGITVMVTKPTGATIKYGTSADRCNQSSSPTYTNGTHTVYYTITHKGYKTVTGSEVVKITAKDINSLDITVAAPADEVYNGRAHTPDVTVKDGEKKLTKDKDYTLSYKNNINAGTATVTITGKGVYTGTREVTFGILKAPIKPRVEMDNWVFDTVPSTPRLVTGSNPGNGDVTYEYKAEGATDDTYTTNKPTSVGSYVVRATVAATKNYESGTDIGTFSILPNDGIVATAEGYYGVYDGQPHDITVTVTKPEGATVKYGETAASCTQSSLPYTDVGKHPVYYQVTSVGYIPVSGMKYVEIVAKSADSEDISIDIKDVDNQVYDGKAHEPEIVVKDGGTPLTKGTDYDVSYSNNVHAGTATVTITGKGNYKGTQNKTFTIKQKELTANVSATDKDYDGTTDAEITVTVETGVGEEKLTITGVTGAFENENVGEEKTVNVNSSGMVVEAASTTTPETRPANYKVTVPKTATADINEKNIGDSDIKVDDILPLVYNGQARTPEVSIKDGKTPLTNNKDYTLDYKNNTDAGTATVTITGTGNYKGTKEVTFTILPKPVTADVSAANKDYDGTTDAEITVTVDTDIDGEALVITGVTGAFENANVGEDKRVNVNSTGKSIVADPEATKPTTPSNYDVTIPTTTTANITKAKPSSTSTPGAAQNLTYNGAPQTLVTDGVTSDGDYKYIVWTGVGKPPKAADGWSTELPSKTDAGTYNVYYYLAGDDNHEDGEISGPLACTIAPYELTTANIGTIDQQLHTGSEVKPAVVVTVTLESGATTLVMGADKDYTVSYANNVNVGTDASVTVTGVGNYTGTPSKNFSIVSNPPRLAENGEPTEKNPVYNQADQELINAGKAEDDYKLQYSLDKIKWTDNVTEILGQDAGEYTVYYRTYVPGSSKPEDTSDSAQMTAHIQKAVLSSVTLSSQNFAYDTTQHTVTVTEVKTQNGLTVPTSEYDVTGTLQATDAATYTVTATAKGTSKNYTGSADATWNIGEATILYTKTADYSVVYGLDKDGKPVQHGTSVTVTTPATGATVKFKDPKTGNYTLDECPTYSDVGEYTIEFQISAPNYETKTGSTKLTITKATPGLTLPTANNRVYDGKTEELLAFDGAVTGGTLLYYVGENAPEKGSRLWSTKVPEGKNVGSYPVWFMVEGDANYNDIDAQKLDVIISKADITDIKVEQADALEYNGEDQTAPVKASGKAPDGGKVTFQYSTSPNGPWGDDVPEFKHAGTHRVYYKASAEGCKDVIGYFDIVIDPKPVTAKVEAADKDYDGSTDAKITVTVDTGVEGEKLNVTGVTGAFEDANSSKTKKTVNIDDKDMAVSASPDTPDTLPSDYAVTVPETTKAKINGKSIVDPDDPTKPAEGITVEPQPIPDQEYTGKEIEPKPVIKDGDKVLEEGKDYTLKYKDNVNVGEATVIVQGKGNYYGELTLHFNIVAKPAKPVAPKTGDSAMPALWAVLALSMGLGAAAIVWKKKEN